MSLKHPPPSLQRVCFITIGATASFDSLVKASLSPSFLAILDKYGYTDLRLQHGEDGHKIFENFEKNRGTESKYGQGLRISGFDFNKRGLGAEMRAAKGGPERSEGVVISHAGKI